MAVSAAPDQLWDALHLRGDRLAKDTLILRYAPLVKSCGGPPVHLFATGAGYG